MSKKLKEEIEPLIGPFFVIGGQVYGYGEPVSEKNSTDSFFDSNITHMQYWTYFTKNVKPEYKDIDYAEFPRGRIIYDVKNDKFIGYADKDILNNAGSRYKVKQFFNLGGKNVDWRSDDHYVCANCSEEVCHIVAGSA